MAVGPGVPVPLLVPSVALAALAAASLAAVPPAVTIRDPAGDVTGGPGPDITAVALSHGAATLTIRVTFAKAPPLIMGKSGVDMLLVLVDRPPYAMHAVAGDGWVGSDCAVGTHGPLARGVAGCGRGKPAFFPVAIRGRTVTLAVPRKALGSPAELRLVVFAGREVATEGTQGGGGDQAPDRGVLRYRLSG